MVGKKKQKEPAPLVAAPLPVPGVDPQTQAVQQSLLQQLAELKQQGDRQLEATKQQQLVEQQAAAANATQLKQQNALAEQQNTLNAQRYREAEALSAQQETLTAAQTAAAAAKRTDQRQRTTGLLGFIGKRSQRPTY